MTLLDAAASGEKVGFLALLGGPATLERPGFANAFLEAISGHRGRLGRGPKVEAEKPLDFDAGPSDVRLGGEPVGQDRLLDRWQDAPGDCLPAPWSARSGRLLAAMTALTLGHGGVLHQAAHAGGDQQGPVGGLLRNAADSCRPPA